MSEGVQRGLQAGANTFLEFGTHESAHRPLPRHPRRAPGMLPMSDYEHLALRAARARHDHHHQPPRTHERHWAADTSGTRRRVGPVPRRRRTRWSASSPARATRAFCAGGDLKAALAGELRDRRQPRRRRARPVTVDRHLQADHRGRQRRRLRRRPRVGVLDRPRDRRRARHVRGDLPAVEHRPGRRRHPAPHPHPRLSPRDRADHHRSRHRRPRGGADRAGQPGRASAGRVCSVRSNSPRSIAALPQPALRTDLEAARSGQGRPLDDGLRIEAECFGRSISAPETVEGLRRFNDRDHPDRRPDGTSLTPGLARAR